LEELRALAPKPINVALKYVHGASECVSCGPCPAHRGARACACAEAVTGSCRHRRTVRLRDRHLFSAHLQSCCAIHPRAPASD
jgi:hypothetical protein